jgi:hypothetical protein
VSEPEFAPDLPRVERFELRAMSAREIDALPDPPDWDKLAGPLVRRGCRTIIVADTGHGKTTLSAQLSSAALTGDEILGFTGAGVGPLLVVDLEQGIRSIKRTNREAGLAERDDVFYVVVPDGLALDADEEHKSELERVIAEIRPAIVVLDPYYKAHRGESNEERGVVDLMRYLDGLRTRYGFALIVPAHPRKDQTGRDGPRKLKLDDVAGSGAVTRGAEVVVALERLSHGYARLRVLKDRDGDLTVGEEWPLLFTRGEGFRLDPKAEETEAETERRVLELGSDETWRTYKEYAAELHIQQVRAKRILEALAEAGRVEVAVGPPGRSPKAHCYRTALAAWEQSGSVAPLPLDLGDGSTEPDGYREPSAPGSVDEWSESTGSVDATPTWAQVNEAQSLSRRTGTHTHSAQAVIEEIERLEGAPFDECLICGNEYELDEEHPERLRCPACVVEVV